MTTTSSVPSAAISAIAVSMAAWVSGVAQRALQGLDDELSVGAGLGGRCLLQQVQHLATLGVRQVEAGLVGRTHDPADHRHRDDRDDPETDDPPAVQE